MMSNELKERLNLNTKAVEDLITELIQVKDDTGLLDVTKYSLLSGGKRIRPFIVLEAYRLFSDSENVTVALPFACALEMIHTYSLIHDDLPCMDNDDYRRGRLTSHKVFGEDKALLAGDTLLTYAFEVASNSKDLSANSSLSCIQALAKFAGYSGMAGGQMIDLDSEKNIKSLDQLLKMHSLKTSALIICALQLGYLCSVEAPNQKILSDLEKVGYNIGVAFQIVDDILDKTSNSTVLGKLAGSDEKNGKKTTLSYLSLKDAKDLVISLTNEAISIIKQYCKSDNCVLIDLFNYLIDREK
ncbi:MAG: polyprenyl synthetase family protein [Clostridia bacterium]|nr:polyprenyl synthetase family protein [Clostridia bacterium]